MYCENITKFLSLIKTTVMIKCSDCFHRYLQMPLTLYIAEDGQKRMIEKTAKNVATSRATTLRTDRYCNHVTRRCPPFFV